MSLGKNIQHLRRRKKLTQEQLAAELSVSRQTVSKWESDEMVPELGKLIALSDLFSCQLDTLVREDVSDPDAIFSDIRMEKIPSFRMARYVMITPNPEADVNRYMREWAKSSGLLAASPNAKLIGWDFPYVSLEQKNRFHMWGYAAAYILPEDFHTDCPGVEYADQIEAEYAVITIYDPFAAAFDRIPTAYRKIMDYLQANGFREKPRENVLSCFEYVYEKDGITCMDVCLNVESVSKTESFTNFS